VKRYNEGVACLVFCLLLLSAAEIKAQYLHNDITYARDKIIIVIKTPYLPLNPITNNGDVATGLTEVDNLNKRFSVNHIWQLFPKAEEHGSPEMAGYYSITFASGNPLEDVLAAYDQLGSIDHVEPIGIHKLFYNPNDANISSQWAITKIHARQGWDINRGDSAVVLGIADTGVDWNHPDLAANIWMNSAETVDGIDNDGNGYVDDIRGWDWVTGQSGWPGEDANIADNNPMDFYGHGTHCAGIASAVTDNGTGVAGIGFNCSIMCLRIGWYDISGYGLVDMSYAASAMYYAANKGAKAINCSWGSSNSGGLGTATTYATSHGVVVVSAAGNDSSQVAPYLCSRTDVIAVAATDQNDQAAYFSNFGTWVDVSAPGVNIYSTYFDDTYAYLDGTSMAAPHVVGLAGLIAATSPSMTRAQIQARIISTTDNIDALNPGYSGKLGSGRINVYNALNGLGSPILTPLPVSPIGAFWLNTPHPTIIWSDTSAGTHYHLQVDDNSGFSSTIVNDSSLTDTTRYCADSLGDGTWYWRVRSGNGHFWSDYTLIQSFRIDTNKPNTTTLLAPALNSWTNDRTPTFTWQSVTDVGGSGVLKYLIEIDDDSLFALAHLLDDSTAAINYTPTLNLPADIRVFWRVRARDRAGNYANYASSAFNLDNTPPASPIAFNVTPNGWASNPNFTLNWTNPADPSGITRAYYKLGSAPTSSNDTTGHLAATPPVAITAQVVGVQAIYIWLIDGVGNAAFVNNSRDSIRFDNSNPNGSIASSPSTSSTLIFAVSWTAGTDIGSGLSGSYNVRFKDGTGGTWLDWLTNFSGLANQFTGVQGHTYFFEVGAIDNAGNVEIFSGTAETSTLVDTTYTGPPFVPGDANGSGVVNGIDVVYLVSYLKGGPPPPDPILRADANGSCTVNGIDVVYLVSYLKGGPAPYAGNCR
jgi:subtilisin family serine protease